jgi:hypothetical protein
MLLFWLEGDSQFWLRKVTYIDSSQFKGGISEAIPPLEKFAGVDNTWTERILFYFQFLMQWRLEEAPRSGHS